MARTKKVTISLNAGKIEVDPYWAIFKAGRPLIIKYATPAPWAVGFHGKRTPTDTLVIQGHGSQMDGPHTADREGHFPYTVALVGINERFPDGTVFLDAACPEIIIE